MGQKTRVQWFSDDNSEDSSIRPFEQRKRTVVRHQLNNRQESSVKATYIASVKMRGVCEGVRGEAWLVQPEPNPSIGAQQNPFRALSFGSLSEAFYCALNEEPTNPNLIASLRRGLESRLLHHATPHEVLRFLVFRDTLLTSFLVGLQLHLQGLQPQLIIYFRPFTQG